MEDAMIATHSAHAFAPATSARPISETRLLVIQPRIREAPFADLAEHFHAGDVLVVNDAATIPSSIFGETEDGAPIELRLLALPDETREADVVVLGAGNFRTPTELRAPPPALRAGDLLLVADLEATVVSAGRARQVRVRFERPRDEVIAELYRVGRPVQYAHIHEPLPLWDVQNIYASEPWAAEMPSAGRPLDFATLDALRKRRVAIARITHGAGLSSIGDAGLDASLPWVERYRIPIETEVAIRNARRVIAVGTSVVRALESSAKKFGEVRAEQSTTSLRIDAHHTLRAVSGLLTGMHDGTTSHADLLSAFVPPALLEAATDWASSRGFLGHEFGDSCLIMIGESSIQHPCLIPTNRSAPKR